MYQIEVQHSGLNKYRCIKGNDEWVVKQRADAQCAQWDAEWSRVVDRSNRLQGIFMGKFEAQERTAAAEAALDGLSNLLKLTSKSHALNWPALILNTPFSEPDPALPEYVAEPEAPEPISAPALQITLIEKFFKPLREGAIRRHGKGVALAASQNTMNLALWRDKLEHVRAINREKLEAYQAEFDAHQSRECEHFDSQHKHNDGISHLEAQIGTGDPEGIENRLSFAFLLAHLPEPFSTEFEIEYSSTTKSCVIDYILPSPDEMPTLKEVRFVQSRNELVEKHFSESEQNKLYDATLYRAALTLLHIALSSDPECYIERVTLNGWVDHIVKSTGMDDRTCILTIGVNRIDFERVDLQRVDPKECFKALKGVAASKLIGLAPVAPLETRKLEDSRFITSQDVAGTMEAGVNIAAMDWSDFEHLVRQVFEHEFSSAGTEVRVTQASRDGGVDAIVHDPDPIRGGKIIIQAKRYTNTVDVSAVRDLYGTVVNEGASKGILVTTSQYGPDARKFAQGKPITLIDGGNFLHLLEKMGMKARIDLKEAKAIYAASQRT